MAGIVAMAETMERIHRLESMASRRNVLRGYERSLECVASGITRRGQESRAVEPGVRNLCGMPGRQHIPASGETVVALSAYFSAGRTFQQYLPHLGEAFVLLGHVGLEDEIRLTGSRGAAFLR